MKPEDLRFIVFVLDSKIEQHDGKVVTSMDDARKFVKDCIDEKWGEKMIIGSFVFNPDHREMNIGFIETFGLGTSKKNITQLDLFQSLKQKAIV